jgi:hypothetical protein
MEIVIIAIVAVAAFAAVLYPLLRRRRGVTDDAAEFDEPRAPVTRADADHAGRARRAHREPAADPATGLGVIPPMAAGPATPVAPGGTTTPRPVGYDSHDSPVPASEDRIEAEVARYREALRAGTICRKCGEANSPESRFCADCGAALPLTESHEFE